MKQQKEEEEKNDKEQKKEDDEEEEDDEDDVEDEEDQQSALYMDFDAFGEALMIRFQHSKRLPDLPLRKFDCNLKKKLEAERRIDCNQ